MGLGKFAKKTWNTWVYEHFVELNDEKILRERGTPWGTRRENRTHHRMKHPDMGIYLDPVPIEVPSTRPEHPTAFYWQWPSVSVYVPISLKSESKDIVASVKAALSDQRFRRRVAKYAGTDDGIWAVVGEKLQMHQDDTRIQVDFQNAQLICSYETTVKLLRSEKEKS